MAVPKKKTSKSKRNKRRFSNRWVLTGENSVSCPNCGATKRQHRVCDDCGHYDGNQVFHPDTQAS